ncbi:MAG: CinA family protein [Nanoarchaeota archaeon]
MGLVENIGKLLKDNKSKLSTAESCTAGYISSVLTTIPGSSSYFEGSLVVYSNAAKINVLGVEKELIDTYTEVSEEVAKRMAEKIKEVMKTEYSIATTGYADINGFGTETNPPGTIYVAVSTPQETVVKRLELKDGRVRNVYLAAVEGLETLLSLIENRQA